MLKPEKICILSGILNLKPSTLKNSSFKSRIEKTNLKDIFILSKFVFWHLEKLPNESWDWANNFEDFNTEQQSVARSSEKHFYKCLGPKFGKQIVRYLYNNSIYCLELSHFFKFPSPYSRALISPRSYFSWNHFLEASLLIFLTKMYRKP